MKAGYVTTMIAAAIVGLMSFNAQAQSASSPLAASAMASSPAASHKAMKAADRRLQKDVLRALARTKGLNASGISVRARSGVVTLQGTVPEQSETDIAARAAESVAGVTLVKNALGVRDEGQ
ncbi:BON domain-containing protein [Paraburkholderia sp. 22B1P]|uniref:BON domain-containing protein n=1 Tax=Paraburkholderia sp. 22B1P TaxID=3080498 RepID=UPI003091EFF0|nr:BON domain-containing protein [Paraburkholderia sp. 22B1P]